MQNYRDTSSDFKKSFNFFFLVCQTFAACILPWYRYRVGSHFFGRSGAFGLVFMMLIGGLLNSYDMFRYLIAWFVMIILHRICMGLRWWRGEIIHSMTGGLSIFGLIPRVSQYVAKSFIEPLFTFLVAMYFVQFSPVFGKFLLFGSFFLFCKHLIDVQLYKTHLRLMRDAQIEQSSIAREYQKGW